MKSKENIPSWIYSRLCYQDLRNPNCIRDTFSEEEISSYGNYLKTNCSCDNCFYGRTELAEYIISKINEYETSNSSSI